MKACERDTFFKLKVYKRGAFSFKMVYKRVTSWTSVQNLLVLQFVEYPPGIM